MGVARKPRAAAAGLEWFPCPVAPKGYTAADGTTLAVVACRPSFVATLYCGDADNPTADHGYRCDNADGTGRNIAGAFIKKPDIRGEWVRGFDNGRGVDVGRNLHRWAGGAVQRHGHRIFGDNTGSGPNGEVASPLIKPLGGADRLGGYLLNNTAAGLPIVEATGADDNSVRGVAMLACLRL